MRAHIKKHRFIFILALFALLTLIINQFPFLIEKYYSTGLYPWISRISRFFLGWIPFSVGDIVYAAAALYIIVKIIGFFVRWKKRRLNRPLLLRYGRKILQALMIVYISFNWLWGFNYNRLGSAWQMQLKFEKYTTEQLIQLTDTLTHRLIAMDAEAGSRNTYNGPKQLGDESIKGYDVAASKFSFLAYINRSVKPEILYNGGNYLGFLGYFNPFTSEAQLNTTIPKILLPAVCCHEMAHQLGYASESEANFVGYLACKESKESAFKYSVYYDMFSYAINDLYQRDTSLAIKRIEALPQRIRDERKLVRTFFRGFKNPFRPFIDWMYDKYLKANSQPKGRESYNEVVGWMIAYANKYGWGQI